MGQAAHKPVFTAQDYLAWEPTQPERHEFLDGEVFAMAGADDRHNTVALNFARGESVTFASVALELTAAQLFAEVLEP